ncbi:MAG: potassium channel family protein [Fretibacterium sp.]|nr:potassium channel family protein [Fretibacterium sp.]
MLFLFCAILLISTLLVWHQEYRFQGSFLDSFWSVLFTLIGQGEFATAPRTLMGKFIVFFLSIVGVALFGVVLSEFMQRVMSSKLKEMMGMNRCKFQGHIVICGWNSRARYIVRELLASKREVAVAASERPPDLPHDVFFVAGNPSDKETLIRTGLPDAEGVILLSELKDHGDDAKTILTGLAAKTIHPDIYAVMELHDPENEPYARLAKVDDIIYSDNLIAEVTSICTQYEGISSFIRDILSSADDGHSFIVYDVGGEFEGKTVGELFQDYRRRKLLPVGLLLPSEEEGSTAAPLWLSRVNPDEEEQVALPMKVVCIRKN